MTNTCASGDNAIVILRDVAYGSATVGHGTAQAGQRSLLLDVYLPPERAVDGGSLRPALVLSHGGAYHRGSKETDEFEQEGSHNTPVPEYCARYAAKGFVCFSVGYRLTQELPAPQARPIRQERHVAPGRIQVVRDLLGLPPAGNDELLNGIEASYADVAQAFNFVQAQAARWHIDPDRIAIGGFSAGAFASAYASYALGVPAAAVISLSGGMDALDAAHYLHDGRSQPPVLLFTSEFDLPGIGERTQALATRAAAVGLGVRSYFVPGKPHFYSCETEVRLELASQSGAPAGCSIEAAIDDFLRVALAPHQPVEH